jgi:hypothetical protein
MEGARVTNVSMDAIAAATPPTLQRIMSVIKRHRFDLTTEKAAQAEIETVLQDAKVEFTREKRLSGRDIPDFFVPALGLAIEVKMKGAGKMKVYRQLERYAEHDTVQAILLVSNLAMGLPPTINGKPTHFLSLGAAWL